MPPDIGQSVPSSSASAGRGCLLAVVALIVLPIVVVTGLVLFARLAPPGPQAAAKACAAAVQARLRAAADGLEVQEPIRVGEAPRVYAVTGRAISDRQRLFAYRCRATIIGDDVTVSDLTVSPAE